MILELALACCAPPSPETRRTQADHCKEPMDAPDTAGPFDGAEETVLVIAGDTNAGEVGTHDPKQREENR